jgi:hypothetical protein
MELFDGDMAVGNEESFGYHVEFRHSSCLRYSRKNNLFCNKKYIEQKFELICQIRSKKMNLADTKELGIVG